MQDERSDASGAKRQWADAIASVIAFESTGQADEVLDHAVATTASWRGSTLGGL